MFYFQMALAYNQTLPFFGSLSHNPIAVAVDGHTPQR